MNILFVNYGDFTTNSLNHIGGFANWLGQRDQSCLVAVPTGLDTLPAVHEPRFATGTYADVLSGLSRFPDGRPADILHAWTPREGVRRFILAHQRLHPATRVVLHLEDNEQHLTAAFTGQTPAALLAASDDALAAALPDALSHPRRAAQLLAAADAATVIIDSLRAFLPSGLPTLTLPPGVDSSLYHPQTPNEARRLALGFHPTERIIVYTGSTTFASAAAMAQLLHAIQLLRTEGLPVRLLRTGYHPPEFTRDLDFDWTAFTVDVGFRPKADLPGLLALADVLIQPGSPGPFDDFRLPSKLPEFLAMGRPVIMPAVNLGQQVRDGVEAVLLQHGTAREIADCCRRVLDDTPFARRLAEAGRRFALTHFDADRIGHSLLAHYTACLARPPRALWATLTAPHATEAALQPALHRDRLLTLLEPNTPAAREAQAAASSLTETILRLEENAAAGAGQATQTRLTTDIARLTEQLALARQHAANLAGQLAHDRQLTVNLTEQLASRDQELVLSRQHAANLTEQLDQGREHAVDLAAQLANRAEELALSHQHAANLTAQLTSRTEELALSHQHAANLSAGLDQARRAQATLQASYNDFRTSSLQRIRELEIQSTTLHRQVYNFQAELVRVTQEAEHRLRYEIAVRDDKIRRMQDSFSWQATAPLRALRRLLLDRPASSPPAPALTPAPATPPAAQQPRCQIDYPHFWHLPAGPLALRGWCLLPDGHAPAKIRLRLGEREFPGQAGLPRPDVAAVHGSSTAAHCGFRVECVLEAGHPPLVLEAADATDHWHVLFSTTPTVFHPAMPPEIASYASWLHLNDPVGPATLRELHAEVSALPNPPLISVLMPVYNAPERWLRRAIESVRAQIYDHWELCIADDASTAPHIRSLLQSFAADDPRIKVVFRPVNGHISASSNSALELAVGPYVALLDHDDELPPHALARMALEITRHPDAVFFYSDEDKIDEQGHRFDAYFKPDFLPDLLLGQNCLSHLSVILTEAVRTVGGFRVGLEGSQDWDLALRIVEDLPAAKVRHVPEILYHWRAIAGSTALAVGEKSYAVRAAERALTDHLARRGLQARLEPVPGDHWRVHFALPDPAPLVSLIIPTRDRLSLTRTCVESILAKTDYPAYEILILDNQSVEPATLAWFTEVQARDPRVKVLPYPHPFNYSALNNFGVQQAAGEIVGLLNNDLEVINSGWLSEMVSHAVRPGVGAVGAMLYYPNDTIQHAGVILGLGGVANHAFYRYPRGTHGYFNRARLVQNYSAVTGACLVIRKAIFQEVGGLNAEHLAIAFNDIDFCLKVRVAGYRNLWTPFAELYHHESASRGSEDTPEKLARFAREVDYMRHTWAPMLDHDPAYNPNFTLEIEGFKLASPPRRPPAPPPLTAIAG